ncbi:restriction endonuclease subunit S [Mannheimia haemolytica]|uniref:restriction endonuclease subunit S n=1 Tax=Mannheimia haemolytica TaxID=75985 RepID=UPI00115F5D36|nr:restriction endonuclease subunit S [Mannheimia haemolytica]TRC56180.1 restriction endonuclease subunit S [Mannheimia haemolytica]TRC62953.1 restriction endonuclease subunit S [Mannheimia haemolytica]
MSNSIIEKLLNGAEVEWKPLGEVAELKRGKTITAKDKTEGNIPVISGGQKPAYYTGEYNREGETITIAGSGAYAGFLMYWNEPIFLGDAFSVKPDLDILITKYVYHFLLSKQQWIFNLKKGSGVPHVYPKDLAILEIPIPPLEIQQKIVKTLDKFTELEATLEATLEAELALRKKQYQYYRETLLTFPQDLDRGYNDITKAIGQVVGKNAHPTVVWKSLGEIGEARMCKRILKEQTSNVGDIPFYKIGTFGKKPNAYISRELFEDYKQKYSYPRKGNILISASGTIGRTVIFDGEDSYFQDSNIVWIENDESQVLDKFLFYLYQIADWNIAEGGTIQRLYNDNLKKLKIPVPPLSEQQKIVNILDKFDSLTNSITEGLPKEIKLRREQYGYYREQLLNFPKP